MRLRRLAPLLLLPGLVNAQDEGALGEGKTLYETHCGACHDLSLPDAQRLDRNGWQWVISDMVQDFGCNWLTEEQQQLILDYLVETHGPN